MSIGGHNPPGVTIASLEGDGNVVLTYLSDTPNTLTVGSNNRSTTFAGVIQDRSTQIGGSLAKVGNGTLTLTGPNTYAGGTTVNSGVLKVSNSFGSGTGSGLLRVNKGTLAGSGIIGGEVIVGRKRGTGGAALLEPSLGSGSPSTLTIQGALTFNAVSTYAYKLDSGRRKGDMVVTKGLRIESGAQFSASDLGSAIIPPGKVFTAVNNTAMTLISGAFANLVDGTIVAIGENMFQVSYTGGDGNDLTLTVVTP